MLAFILPKRAPANDVFHAVDNAVGFGGRQSRGHHYDAPEQDVSGLILSAKKSVSFMLGAAISERSTQCEVASALDVARQRVTEAVDPESTRHAPLWWLGVLAKRRLGSVVVDWICRFVDTYLSEDDRWDLVCALMRDGDGEQ